MKTFKQNKKRHITIERNYYLGEKIGVLNCSQALRKSCKLERIHKNLPLNNSCILLYNKDKSCMVRRRTSLLTGITRIKMLSHTERPVNRSINGLIQFYKFITMIV